MLLAAGANVKVRAVTGDDAISMGEGRLGDATMRVLRSAYQESAEELIDFTVNPDALAAQVEHVSGCKHCREKHARAATLNVPPTARELALRTRLRNDLVAALGAPSSGGACADGQREGQTRSGVSVVSVAMTAALVEAAISLDTSDVPAANNTPPTLAHTLPDRFRSLLVELGVFFQVRVYACRHAVCAAVFAFRVYMRSRGPDFFLLPARLPFFGPKP